MSNGLDHLCILTGNANPKLAQDIADNLGVKLVDTKVAKFNNGEIQVVINESIRGKDIFIIQPTSQPVNDNLMELLIMADACKRASAHSVTAVVPYYAYSRQDRKAHGREPISAKLVANLMTVAGVTRFISVDLHADQIQGFFDIPVDHLRAQHALALYFQNKFPSMEDVVVVSPDLGGATRARNLASILNVPIAIIEKRRPAPGQAKVMNVIGNIDGKTCIMVDDMVDTAGSLCKGADALVKMGAKEVYTCCSHGILTDPAVDNINKSVIKELVMTDTIPLPEDKKSDKIVVVTLAKMLAEFISAIQQEIPVSSLYRWA